MRIGSWNLNHRVGKTRFREEAVDAAMALDVDAIFFNEYFPGTKGHQFERRLADGGWSIQLITPAPPERANRTFLASRVPAELDVMPPPSFDHQLGSNTLCVRFPLAGLRVIGLRVPMYINPHRHCRILSWEWLEASAAQLVDERAIIIGDLNVGTASPRANGGEHFRRIQASGYQSATPTEFPSYYSNSGHTSIPDHLLHTSTTKVADARFVLKAGGHTLAGGPGALSDHAALVATVVE